MGKPSKRVQKAAKKRAAVMSTEEFRIWWLARRQIHPLPSDPYRAFMIDRGLVARVTDKSTWKPRANRVDTPPIDTYHGARKNRNVPQRRYPKHRFRPNFVPVAARPIGELTAEEKELQKMAEEMAKHYNTDVPQVIFERREGYGTSAYYRGADSRNFLKPFIKIGVKGLNKKKLPESKAVLGHEFGHHAHHRGAESILGDLNIVGYPTATRIQREKAAWLLADPFLTDQRPKQKWLKKHFLGTYLGTSGHGKRKVDWGRSGVASAILGNEKRKRG